jgi:hypothetical protein
MFSFDITENICSDLCKNMFIISLERSIMEILYKIIALIKSSRNNQEAETEKGACLKG